MSYTELTVWTRGIIMDKEGRDIVNSVAASARLEGKYSQAMENYVDNPDRTNCPTRKYCRVSDNVIENELTYENEQPNIIVLVEGTMVKGWDYMRGMPPGGTLVINTHYTPDYMIRFVPGAERPNLGKRGGHSTLNTQPSTTPVPPCGPKQPPNGRSG